MCANFSTLYSVGTKLAEENKYDGRPCLGLPGYYRKKMQDK